MLSQQLPIQQTRGGLMRHIHQIGTEGFSYTYILTDQEDLENHPAIVNFPDKFEIIDEDVPDNAQILNFSD